MPDPVSSMRAVHLVALVPAEKSVYSLGSGTGGSRPPVASRIPERLGGPQWVARPLDHADLEGLLLASDGEPSSLGCFYVDPERHGDLAGLLRDVMSPETDHDRVRALLDLRAYTDRLGWLFFADDAGREVVL